MNFFKNDKEKINMGNILGISLILAGIMEILLQMPYIDFWDLMTNPYFRTSVLTYYSFIAGGIAVLLTHSWKHASRVSFAGIVMGTMFILSNMYFLDMYTEDMFVIGQISFYLGIVTIIVSLGLLFGYSHYSLKLLECIAIMTAIEVYPIYSCWRIDRTLSSLIDLYPAYIDFIPIILLCIVFMACLYSEVIKITPPTKRVDKDLRTVSDIIQSTEDTYITPHDLQTLLEYCDQEYRYERSLIITLRVENSRHVRRLIVRYIGESQEPVAYVSSANGKNFIQSFRFNIMHTSVSENGDMVRIYGKYGVFVDIVVHEYQPVKGFKEIYTARLRNED